MGTEMGLFPSCVRDVNGQMETQKTLFTESAQCGTCLAKGNLDYYVLFA
jgi:hypothetical protein